MYHRRRGFSQLVGREVTAAGLRQLLPRSATIVAFNGHCFDLPVIRQQLGIARRLPGMDDRDAIHLWQQYQSCGDKDALRLLLAYNREDVMNLARIRMLLDER